MDHYHIFLILLFCFKIETRITCSSFDWRAVPQSGRKIITICSSNSWIWYNGYKISPLNIWNISLTKRNLVMAIMWIRLEIENLSSPLNGITGKSFQALELSREWLIVPHVVLKEEIVVIINCPPPVWSPPTPQCAQPQHQLNHHHMCDHHLRHHDQHICDHDDHQ